MEEPAQKIEEPRQPMTKRPFLLTLICLFSFVLFGFISILFFLALFYSGWITEVVNKYTPENMESRTKMLAFILGGFLLHATSLTGTVLLWQMKRKGYIIFAVSGLIITAYQLFQTKISFLTTAVYIVLIILFGIFYKRLR